MGNKALRWFGSLLAALALWVCLFTEVLPGYSQYSLVQLAPLLGLFAFGLYSLVRILYNVATFPTCPEAATALKKQMATAEADLKKKGFDFNKSRARKAD